MSKRPRDEASIASIRAILGDIPIQTIENLLHRSNNNVEAAVNLYFSGPLPSSTPAAAPKSSTQAQWSSQSSSGSSRNSTAIKYYIGDLVITGMILPYDLCFERVSCTDILQ